jgi:DTW domain-containing protein YfiP
MKRLRNSCANPYEGKTPAERGQEVRAFLESLQFSIPMASLDNAGRDECPKCNRRRQYYCYDCLEVCRPQSHPPPLNLPIKVYVILHPGETRGKSTSLAASTISPNITVITYPNVPEHLSPEDTVVLYPSDQAVGVEELFGDTADGGNTTGSASGGHTQFKNVVFIDSTWRQSRQIARDERVKAFKHVRIRSRVSLFWRFQDNDPSYLATVEAIYYFLREFVTAANRAAAPVKALEGDVEQTYYHGEVDDLMYYYVHQYITIQRQYSAPAIAGDETAAAKKEFTTRHFEGYVLEGVDWNALLNKCGKKDK